MHAPVVAHAAPALGLVCHDLHTRFTVPSMIAPVHCVCFHTVFVDALGRCFSVFTTTFSCLSGRSAPSLALPLPCLFVSNRTTCIGWVREPIHVPCSLFLIRKTHLSSFGNQDCQSVCSLSRVHLYCFALILF